MEDEGEVTWIPRADTLVLAAGVLSLIGGVLPLLVAAGSRVAVAISSSACAASVAALAGYIPATLAHYRLILRSGGARPRGNPEPAEKTIASWTAVVSVALAIVVLTLALSA